MDNGVGKRTGITISLSVSAGGGGRGRGGGGHDWGLDGWEAQCRGGFLMLVTCKSVETGVKLLFSLQLYFLSLGVASPKWTGERRRRKKEEAGEVR